MIYHVFSKLVAIDEDDAEVGVSGRLDRSRREPTACDKYALRRLVLPKRFDKFADCTGTDIGFVPGRKVRRLAVPGIRQPNRKLLGLKSRLTAKKMR